jgi:hypothetical protein
MMNIGDKVTVSEDTLIMGYHRGGAYFRIAKKGTPKLATRRAGSWSRNKYLVNKGIVDYDFQKRGSHHRQIQCYGEHRFEPGEMIGEVLDIQDTHLDLMIESTTFDNGENVDQPFKIAVGIELDKNTKEVFEVFDETKSVKKRKGKKK